MNVCVSRHLKQELAWAIDKRLWIVSNIMSISHGNANVSKFTSISKNYLDGPSGTMSFLQSSNLIRDVISLMQIPNKETFWALFVFVVQVDFFHEILQPLKFCCSMYGIWIMALACVLVFLQQVAIIFRNHFGQHLHTKV